MPKYSVLISVDASITVEVEAPDEETAKELAFNTAECPSVCHYCSKYIQVGEPLEALEASEI